MIYTHSYTYFKTVKAMREYSQERGNHFFDRDTVKFFNTRFERVDGRYVHTFPQDPARWNVFVTSEAYTADEAESRRYTIRQIKEDGSVVTLGKFQQFKTYWHARAALVDFVYMGKPISEAR